MFFIFDKINVSLILIVPCSEAGRKTWKSENLSCLEWRVRLSFQERHLCRILSPIHPVSRLCSLKHNSWWFQIWPVFVSSLVSFLTETARSSTLVFFFLSSELGFREVISVFIVPHETYSRHRDPLIGANFFDLSFFMLT